MTSDARPDPTLTMARALVQFRPGDLADDLAARHDYEGRSTGVRRDLVRYYAVLQAELERLALDDGEVAFLLDVVRTTTWSERNYQLLPAHVEDLGKRRKDKRAAALATKLRSVGPAACLALIDAGERVARTKGPVLPGLPGLRIAGLMPGGDA